MADDDANMIIKLLQKLRAEIETMRTEIATFKSEVNARFDRVEAEQKAQSRTLGRLRVDNIGIRGRVKDVEGDMEAVVNVLTEKSLI